MAGAGRSRWAGPELHCIVGLGEDRGYRGTMATRVGIDPIGVDEVQDALATHGWALPGPRVHGRRAARMRPGRAALGHQVRRQGSDNEDPRSGQRSDCLALDRGPPGGERSPSARADRRRAGLARGHGIAELSVRFIHDVSSAARWSWRRRGTMTDSVNTQIRRVLSVHARLPVDVDSLTDQTDH